MAEFPTSTNQTTISNVLWCNAIKGQAQLINGESVVLSYMSPDYIGVLFPEILSTTLFGTNTPVPLPFRDYGDRCVFTGTIVETGVHFDCTIQLVNSMGQDMFSGQYITIQGGGSDEQSGGWGGQ